MNSLFVFFPIQHKPCHKNIIADKSFNLFDECAAKCVYLCPQEDECTSSSWGDSKMHSPSTIANSQRMPNKINKIVAIAKHRNFHGTSDTIRYLKIFRITSNEIPF